MKGVCQIIFEGGGNILNYILLHHGKQISPENALNKWGELPPMVIGCHSLKSETRTSALRTEVTVLVRPRKTFRMVETGPCLCISDGTRLRQPLDASLGSGEGVLMFRSP